MEPIETPFKYPVVSDEVVQMVKEKTGADCVFIIIAEDSECTHGENCTGHYMDMNGTQFKAPQFMGILNGIAQDNGYKLVPNEEEEDED